MSCIVHARRAATAGADRLVPRRFFRPEKRPRGARRIRDGLWSRPRYGFDDFGREIVAMTHADGFAILWPVRSTADAALLDPDGRVVDRPDAWREARAFAFHWGAP